MKPKDLPQWLQEIVKQRTIEDNGHFDINTSLSGLFVFSSTPEGFDYWNDICEHGIIPPQPKQQMEQQIQVRDAERVVSIKHFKYNKATKTFTIKQKDLVTLGRPLEGNEIPKNIIITNRNTGTVKLFKIDATLKETITLPKSTGKAYTITYYMIDNVLGIFKIDVVMDTPPSVNLVRGKTIS